MRRHPPHHLSPARANHPAGQDPGARLSLPSHHSNAPIKPESQSILSKIVALMPSKGSFGKSFSASTEFGRLARRNAIISSDEGECDVVSDFGHRAASGGNLILVAPAGVQRSAACNVYAGERCVRRL